MMELGIKALACSIMLYAVLAWLRPLLLFCHRCLTEKDL